MIEELKKCNYVKVIILVNENGMSDNAKDILKKYEEKVIDRTYHITKIPSKINWGNLGIHASFMQDFIKKHYQIINLISGIFLVLIGVLMATGTLGWLLGLLS